jgi:hypothetical protein
VLRVIGIAAISLLALIGAGFIVILAQAWHYVGKSDVAKAEGEDYGRNTNDQACFAEVVDMVETRKPWIVTIEVEFFRACLQSASSMTGFCDGVPPPSNEEEGQSWRMERCRDLPLEETDCHMILSPVQYHCVERRARAAK